MRRFFYFAAFFTVFIASSGKVLCQTITITEVTQLNFAKLQRPASGSHNITVPRDGSTATGTGTVLIGTPTRGHYRISRSGGGGNFQIEIDIDNINSGHSALTISNFRGIYGSTNINSFPRGNLTRPGTGSGTNFYLGATATYTSAIPAAAFSPAFDIVVTID